MPKEGRKSHQIHVKKSAKPRPKYPSDFQQAEILEHIISFPSSMKWKFTESNEEKH